jgi:hypothetical protein
MRASESCGNVAARKGYSRVLSSIMPRFEMPAEPWQYRVLDALPPSLDEALLREELALTPEQRLERLRELTDLAEEAQRARDGRVR